MALWQKNKEKYFNNGCLPQDVVHPVRVPARARNRLTPLVAQDGVDLEGFRAWAQADSPAARAVASVLISTIIFQTWAVIIDPHVQHEKAS